MEEALQLDVEAQYDWSDQVTHGEASLLLRAIAVVLAVQAADYANVESAADRVVPIEVLNVDVETYAAILP